MTVKTKATSSTFIVIVFVVLCFLIVLLKGVYDYNRFSKAQEKFIFDYKTKLSDLAKVGAAGLAIAAGAGAGVGAGTGESSTLKSRRGIEINKSNTNSQKKSEKSMIEWFGGKKEDQEKIGANNCLFDATIDSCGLRDSRTGNPANSQVLRERCDEVLREEGFPLIPHGEPAGEQYLQALSLILNMKIKVYKGNRNNFVAEIKHSKVNDDVETFSILHVGSQLNGHWIAF